MRFVAALVLPVMLVALNPMPAHAGNLVFNGFYCPPRLPCDISDPTFPNLQSIVTATSGCVSSRMSTNPGQDLFDPAAGLDSSGCLTANPSAFQPAGNYNPVPNCCIQAVPEGGCLMHCKIIE